MTTTLTRERADLLQALQKHRDFLRYTVRDLSDEQAGASPTASQLCLGGIIKHVAAVESGWGDFIRRGPSAMASSDQDWTEGDWFSGFRMLPTETLALLLEHYGEVAAHTDELVATLPSLDSDQPLPQAPWFEQNARWSARRVFLHIIAETVQHAGHADIIRETLDGQKTMG